MDTTHDVCDDPRRALYVLLAGAEGGGPTARAARQAQDEELAGFLCEVQDEVVEEAKRLLARRVAEQEKEKTPHGRRLMRTCYKTSSPGARPDAWRQWPTD